MTNLKINKVMTVENLMMPRYKVIADYPHNPYKVGDLLEEFTNTAFKLTVTYNGNSMDETQANTYPASAIEKMPHLFRKLNWWEERKVEDMPDYVKWDVGIYPTWKKIMKVDKWNSNGSFDHENVTISVINCFPSTEQQYNDYINSKSNAKH